MGSARETGSADARTVGTKRAAPGGEQWWPHSSGSGPRPGGTGSTRGASTASGLLAGRPPVTSKEERLWGTSAHAFWFDGQAEEAAKFYTSVVKKLAGWATSCPMAKRGPGREGLGHDCDVRAGRAEVHRAQRRPSVQVSTRRSRFTSPATRSRRSTSCSQQLTADGGEQGPMRVAEGQVRPVLADRLPRALHEMITSPRPAGGAAPGDRGDAGHEETGRAGHCRTRSTARRGPRGGPGPPGPGPGAGAGQPLVFHAGNGRFLGHDPHRATLRPGGGDDRGPARPARRRPGMCGSVALAPSRISTWCGGTEPLAHGGRARTVRRWGPARG